MIARILVDVPVKAVDRLFDYSIPKTMQDVIEIGMRVIVPFGNRELMGFCLELTPESEFKDDLKPIIRLLDLESFLTQELIDVAKAIAKSSTSVLIKVLETILPSALKAVYQTKVTVVDELGLDADLRLLFDDKSDLIIDSTHASYLSKIKQAVKNDVLRQEYDIRSKASPKSVRFVKLIKDTDFPASEKQKKIISRLLLESSRELPLKQLLDEGVATPSVLKTLEKNGFLSLNAKEEYREIVSVNVPHDKIVSLNPDQLSAYAEIKNHLGEDLAYLIHGVTGSGKTEIYLNCIRDVVDLGQEVIFLVPEISLTPMMVNRLKGRFGPQVAILHSGLSIGEKYDEWRKIIRKEVKIAVGARSAVFAPFTNLGLIVIDECHESSYIQDVSPKYHAIDLAIIRAKQHHAPLIMGSATPNIETYARHKRGYFKLLELPKRWQSSPMPLVEIVDMKREFTSGNTGVLSNLLQQELRERLDKHEQAILLINRRGYSTFVLCRSCGHVITCPNCDISLTYHESDHTLKCHYCGHKEEIPKVCPKCNGIHLSFMGTGTQRIENELQTLYPNARIIRMDNDTTRTKNAHETLLTEFETAGDILLGTQMIAKGLDFPKVTLVGMINADSNLYNADFRSPEKTFQLITQVSGRAGRHDLAGKVVVQAFNPDHYAIRYAVTNDYQGFYQYEMQLRKLAKYVPFYHMVEITVLGENIRDILLAGRDIQRTLKNNLTSDAILLGPVIPAIARIRNKYRAVLTVKYRNEPTLDEWLAKVRELYENDKLAIDIARSSTLA